MHVIFLITRKKLLLNLDLKIKKVYDLGQIFMICLLFSRAYYNNNENGDFRSICCDKATVQGKLSTYFKI